LEDIAERRAAMLILRFGGLRSSFRLSCHTLVCTCRCRIRVAACDAAGVELGEYDRRVLAWLAGYEPQQAQAFAEMIRRAAKV
jgi:hypothetical protein